MRHIKSSVGKTIQSFNESADAYTFGLSDGTSARVPKGPLSDLRELIDRWMVLWPRHTNSLVPPAHQGWGIIDFEDNAPITACSGVLSGQGIFQVPPEFTKIKLVAKAGINRAANPSGLKFVVQASGTVQVTRGNAQVVSVTSQQEEVTLRGDPGTVATINTGLTFTYTSGSNELKTATIPVLGYSSVPSAVGGGTVAPINLYGTLLLPDGSLVNGQRKTMQGTIITDDASSLVPSKVTVGTEAYTWVSGTEEAKLFEVDVQAGATVSYDLSPGVEATFNYCDYPRPAHPPAGTVLRDYCSTDPGSHDRMRDVADGNGGVRQEVVVRNDPTCGYVAPPVTDCQLSQTLVTVSLQRNVPVNNYALVSLSNFNGSPTVNISSGQLPAGLTAIISGQQVVLTGTPQFEGAINAVFTVADGKCSKQFSVTGTVAAAPSSNPTATAQMGNGAISTSDPSEMVALTVTGQSFPQSTAITIEQSFSGGSANMPPRTYSSSTSPSGALAFNQQVSVLPTTTATAGHYTVTTVVKWIENGLPRQLTAGSHQVQIKEKTYNPTITMNINGYTTGSTQEYRVQAGGYGMDSYDGGWAIERLPPNAACGFEFTVSGGGQNYQQDFAGWGGASPSNTNAGPDGRWSANGYSWGALHSGYAGQDGAIVTNRYRFYYKDAQGLKKYLQDQVFNFRVRVTYEPTINININGYGKGSTQNRRLGADGYDSSSFGGSFSINGAPPNSAFRVVVRMTGGNQNYNQTFDGWAGQTHFDSSGSFYGNFGGWGATNVPQTSAPVTITHVYTFYYRAPGSSSWTLIEACRFNFYCTR